MNTIELNVAVGKAARQAAEYVNESLAECIDNCFNEQVNNATNKETRRYISEHFFETLLSELDIVLPREKESAREIVPMNDAEAAEFESRTLMFGRHAGLKFRDVPRDWLHWFANDDPLRLEVNRYLAREKKDWSEES